MDAYVQLTGNVGGTVEFRNTTVPIASFRLAHTPRVRRNGEWGDAPTTWITVTCFRALAENVKGSLHKGHPVVVAGRLRTNVWSKEGQTYERLTLEATTVGHDLTRGTATFFRASRSDEPAEDRDQSVGELIGQLETQQVGSELADEEVAALGVPPEEDAEERIDADGVVVGAG